jgi:hypothetical protein
MPDTSVAVFVPVTAVLPETISKLAVRLPGGSKAPNPISCEKVNENVSVNVPGKGPLAVPEMVVAAVGHAVAIPGPFAVRCSPASVAEGAASALATSRSDAKASIAVKMMRVMSAPFRFVARNVATRHSPHASSGGDESPTAVAR